jgi:hypothetical protein
MLYHILTKLIKSANKVFMQNFNPFLILIWNISG